MKVTLAKTAGFCFGVRRAVKMARQAALEHGTVYTTGPLIHNRYAVEELCALGIIPCDDLSAIPDGATVLIRAHGLPEGDIYGLTARGCTILDATCPDVSKIHIVARRESQKGRLILVLGTEGHPEVTGIVAHCDRSAVVGESAQLSDFIEKHSAEPISVVVQTTMSREKCERMLNTLKNTCKTIEFFDTICLATERHQAEAAEIARRSDAVVVIGDGRSSNSRNLSDLCAQYCEHTFFVEGPHQLDIAELALYGDVFITAGASTPDRIIEEVYETMTDMIENNTEEVLAATEAPVTEEVKPTTASGENFEEMLEESLKSILHMGDKVTGIVTHIRPTEVSVDLGVKQAGYIPTDELSDDPTYVVADNVKLGDEIEAVVVHISDSEGLIKLSKKRLDARKHWDDLEKAVDSREVLEGIIIEQNRGGIVALVKGIRVFIPASQTGLPREASFDPMMKTTQKLRVTEVNSQRRRVVGSIKAVQGEVRREALERVWATIEVGKQYKGTVKSFTTYGAFVDIGGVDGMVHISELSWSRVKHPSDVLTIGQEIEVYVIALDSEKHKISLGYRKSEDNPWNQFETAHNVGDTVNVKIVKFMPFGAFAEVLPGVDGLIHISQIDATRRIGKPDESLKIGQMVDVKIVDIDYEKKKISLSIRALVDPFFEAPQVEEEAAAEAFGQPEDEEV